MTYKYAWAGMVESGLYHVSVERVLHFDIKKTDIRSKPE
jgi:hypothetical protein